MIRCGAEEGALTDRARIGDREAFDVLRARHRTRVYGFIRVRVSSDDTDDLEQEIWIKAWERMPTYDKRRAPFVAFVVYWAGIMLLRHHRLKGRRRAVELLFSELLRRFPKLGEEAEFSNDVDSLAVVPEPDAEEESQRYGGLLEATFCSDSPPHQLLSFGLCKLVADWPPRRIVAELSDTSLREVTVQLEQAYLEESSLPEAVVRPCFARLHDRLEFRFREVVKKKTLATHPRLADRIVGDTKLCDYYTGNPEQNISHWSQSVQRVVAGAASQDDNEETRPRVEVHGEGIAKKRDAGRIRNGGHHNE